MENGFDPLLVGKGPIAATATTQGLAARSAFLSNLRWDVQWSILISFVSPRGPYWLKNISDRSSSFPSSKATMNKVLSEGTGSHRTQNESRIHFRGGVPCLDY